MNTAETLTDADGDVYPHNAQGAGSIRIMKAIKADSLSPREVILTERL